MSKYIRRQHSVFNLGYHFIISSKYRKPYFLNYSKELKRAFRYSSIKMNILILQGPNLNLLGLQSSKSKKKLTLDKQPVQEFFDGGDVNTEADNKTRTETSDDGVKFSVSSLFSSPSDEAIKSLSDTIVEEKAIQNVGGESETGIYKSIFNAYGPRAIDIRTKLQDKLYVVKRIQRKKSKIREGKENIINPYTKANSIVTEILCANGNCPIF